MNGFDFKPPGNPFQMLTPEILAQAAGAAFRPPQPMMMSGLNLQPSLPPMQQQAPSFTLRDGIALASAALTEMGKPKNGGTIMNAGPQGSGPGGAYKMADAMGMAGLNGRQTPSPMGPRYLGGPGTKQDGGFLDFLTNVRSRLGGV